MSVGLAKDGVVCAEPGCSQLDFLPITCPLCHKQYCDAHGHHHTCSGEQSAPPPPSTKEDSHTTAPRRRITGGKDTGTRRTVSCAVCGRPTLVEFTTSCEHCQRVLCLHDRFRCVCAAGTDTNTADGAPRSPPASPPAPYRPHYVSGGVPFGLLQIARFVQSVWRLLRSLLRTLLTRLRRLLGGGSASTATGGERRRPAGQSNVHQIRDYDDHADARENTAPTGAPLNGRLVLMLLVACAGIFALLVASSRSAPTIPDHEALMRAPPLASRRR